MFGIVDALVLDLVKDNLWIVALLPLVVLFLLRFGQIPSRSIPLDDPLVPLLSIIDKLRHSDFQHRRHPAW